MGLACELVPACEACRAGGGVGPAAGAGVVAVAVAAAAAAGWVCRRRWRGGWGFALADVVAAAVRESLGEERVSLRTQGREWAFPC